MGRSTPTSGRWTLALIVVCAACAAGPLYAQETLRWRFAAGDEWEYRLSRERRAIAETVAGSPWERPLRPSSELLTWTLHASVRDVDATGAATVDWSFVRAQLSRDEGEQASDWDSERPAAERGQGGRLPMITFLGAMVGRRLTARVSPAGEIELSGMDSLAAAVRAAAPPELQVEGEGILGAVLGQDPARTLFLGGLAPFPDTPIQVGDSWSGPSALPAYATRAASDAPSTYTLSAIDASAAGRIATVRREEALTDTLDGPADPLFGPSIVVARTVGASELSLDMGLLVRSRSVTDIDMAINVPSPSFRLRTVVREITKVDLVGPVGAPRSPPGLMAEVPEGSAVVDERLHDGDVTEWRLGNGVRVLLKPQRFQEERVLILGVGDGGVSLASEEELASARAALDVIGGAGVGDFTPLELRQALAGRRASVTPQISESGQGVRGMAVPAEVETLLQLVYLTVTAPRADDFVFDAWVREQRERASDAESTARTFRDAWLRLTGLDHPWAAPLTPEVAARAELEGSLAFYRARFADAGDMVFNIVGSFDPATIRPLVERYLGALPSVEGREGWRDRGWRFPEGVVQETARTGVDDGSNTRMLFHGPLGSWSTEERVAVLALGEVLEVRLRRALGSALGEGRYVSVRARVDDRPYERYEVRIDFSSEPDAADAIVDTILGQVSSLATDGPSAEEAERARAALRADHDRNRTSDTWWSNELWLASIRGDPPTGRVFGTGALIDAVDAESIRASVRAYLDAGRFVRLTLSPEQAPAGVVAESSWLGPAAMQQRSDTETEAGYYPVRLEGRQGADGPEYRASFAAYPRDFQYRSNWGMEARAFEARDAALAREGFTRIWRQEFTDARGGARIQGVWVRN